MPHGRRSEFVLGTTISELILLLFFLLLLLFGYHYYESNNRERRQNEEIGRLIIERNNLLQQLSAVLRLVEDRPDEKLIRELVALDRVKALLAKLTTEASEVEQEVAGLREVLRRLREMGEKEFFRSLGEFEKLGGLALCQRDQKRADLNQRELGDAHRRNKELSSRLSKCGGKGEEFVACWRDADGQIEYVFETTITAAGIEISRRWPETRDIEMEPFADALGLAGRTVSIAEFLQDTKGLYEDSKRKACRYFVVITGKRREMNASMFTVYQRIQDHFYHLQNVH